MGEVGGGGRGAKGPLGGLAWPTKVGQASRPPEGGGWGGELENPACGGKWGDEGEEGGVLLRPSPFPHPPFPLLYIYI